jgi:uncharacterized protein YegL
MSIGLPEFVENPENRCPVILLLDTSGSMSGQRIQELNRGLAAFKEDVLKDAQASLGVEVAIVTFGPVRLMQDFVTIDQFTPPKLEADGVTPMGQAIEYALDLLETRKQTYKDNGILYYRHPKENYEYVDVFLNSERLNSRTDDDKTLLLCLWERE